MKKTVTYLNNVKCYCLKMNDLRVHSPCNAALLGYIVVLYFGVQIQNEAVYSGVFYKAKGLKIRFHEQIFNNFNWY